jgi:EAL and modified HD-GYP domain-containing signal transduction protein
MTSKLQDRPGNVPGDRVLLSRQPIYRSDMSVLGYELLFRDSDKDAASFSDGKQATAQVIVSALMEIGMDQMVGRHLAFINFERQLLMGNYGEALPPERVVLEVLESIEPDAALLKKLEQLRTRGYRIALDDFVLGEPYLPMLEFANFVKMDLCSTDWPSIERVASMAGQHQFELIAEKVEQRDQVDRCKEFGFRYFQGYFFCRPQNIGGKQLPANRVATMRLLSQLNNADVRIDELVQTISHDVSLSFRLLRYINSAMCGISRTVESIRHATVLVGLDRMRMWASLIVFSGFDDTSRDVVVAGAIRARMCELIATALRFPQPEQYFLVGMFSVLDAALDRPMEEVVSMLSLAPEISAALLKHQGNLGSVLHCVQAYERRDWTDAQASVQLVQHLIEQTYVEALSWSAGVVGLSSKGPTPSRSN